MNQSTYGVSIDPHYLAENVFVRRIGFGGGGESGISSPGDIEQEEDETA